MSGGVAIELEFLSGVSYSSSPFDRAEPEWPPHPDRIFQALIAASGRDDNMEQDEVAALEWLERRDPTSLSISASPATPRDVLTVFVPPNDARVTSPQGFDGLRVIPDYRRNRQPRFFPAVVPDDPVVRYSWADADGVHEHLAALSRLAREVTYVGHSASLVRMAFLPTAGEHTTNSGWLDAADGALMRMPYAGRLAELRGRYASGRPSVASTVTMTFRSERRRFPQAGAFAMGHAIVFAHAGGFRPSLDAFPLVSKRLRDALLATARDNRLPIAELISGHRADGSPSRADHAALVPLANVGWTYSDGALLGLAILWPRGVAPEERVSALRVIQAFLKSSAGNVPLLHFGRAGSWQLRIDGERDLASMNLRRYAGPSKTWASVLPIVLDRHPKRQPGSDAPSVVATMLVRAGVPADMIGKAQLDILSTSDVRGAPSAPAVRASLPPDSPYRGRPMLHVRLSLPEAVSGPIILGAGRHRGLGLLLPTEEGPR
jgi:CRISPR-associated protein Csb2